LINGNSAGKWDYPDIPANSNIHGPAIEFQLSGLKEQWIRIELRVSGNNELNSEYQLLVR
jgi:hypothetical protein